MHSSNIDRFFEITQGNKNDDMTLRKRETKDWGRLRIRRSDFRYVATGVVGEKKRTDIPGRNRGRCIYTYIYARAAATMPG